MKIWHKCSKFYYGATKVRAKHTTFSRVFLFPSMYSYGSDTIIDTDPKYLKNSAFNGVEADINNYADANPDANSNIVDVDEGDNLLDKLHSTEPSSD